MFNQSHNTSDAIPLCFLCKIPCFEFSFFGSCFLITGKQGADKELERKFSFRFSNFQKYGIIT